MFHTRIQIEKAILSAIVFYNAYPQVAHVLAPLNFTSTDSNKPREIYQACTNLFPNRPIDMLTVANEIRLTFPDDDSVLDELYDLKDGNSINCNNITYWGLILLQIDIKDKFRQKLIDWRDTRLFNLDHVEWGALQEVLEFITPDADILKLVEKCSEYFKMMKMAPEYEGTMHLYNSISKKAQKIKRVDSINTIIQNLYSITNCDDSQVRYECQKFASAIADMITTGGTNPKYTQAINLIYH